MTADPLLYQSTKRNRVYRRKFDHEAALAAYREGETSAAMAARFGVSVSAIERVVVPGRREQMEATTRASKWGVCESCGGPATKLRCHPWRTNAEGLQLCRKCWDTRRRSRFLFDGGVLVAIRCTVVDCANGEQWQPPKNFSGGPRFRDVRPQGVHTNCRTCNTRIRQAYREAHKVPCDRCGEPRLPAAEKRGHGRDSGLCLNCWRTRNLIGGRA